MTDRRTKTISATKAAWQTAFYVSVALAASILLIHVVWHADGPLDAVVAVGYFYIASSFARSALDTMLALGRAHLKERTRHTGTWIVPEHGDRMTIRYDPDARAYWVKGWVAKDEFIPDEVLWAGPRSLWTLITEAEAEGMAPAEDEGTMRIRARLMPAERDTWAVGE